MNKKVTIQFCTNGGNEIAPMVIEYGFMIVVPHPKKIGYEFQNWCKDKELKENFDANKLIENDCTLYAKWTNYAPKKFMTDISSYNNLSNVVKDYQQIYDHGIKQSEEEKDELKKEKFRTDKSNYLHQLNDEYNALTKQYKEVSLTLHEKSLKVEKMKSKLDKKISRKGEEKNQKKIEQYQNEKKEEEAIQETLNTIESKLDTIENKYAEFASKNR